MESRGNNDQNVIIIGAGITGLLIAQGLSKANIQFSIYDGKSSLDGGRSGDWAIGIHWALPKLHDILPPELSERVQEAQTDPFTRTRDVDGIYPVYHGGTGEELVLVPMGNFQRVSRRKMRALCAEGLTVQYNKTLIDIQHSLESGTVTAVFADGTSVTGTALIGADGANSVVRQILVGPEKSKNKLAPVVGLRVVVCYGDAAKAIAMRKLHPIHYAAAHPNGTFTFVAVLDVSDPAKPETWTFLLLISWLRADDNPVTLEDIKAQHVDFTDPWHSAVAWIPDGTPIGGNRVSYWEPVPWDNCQGRISLAGDAAHPMTYHRGQGINHAIADAALYLDALQRVQAGETTLSKAIDEYDKEVVERGGAEVRSSYQNTELLHCWEKLMEAPIMKTGTDKVNS